MFRSFLVVALLALPAFGQTDGGTDIDAMKREFEAKLEAARRETKDLREEMRAQAATQSVSEGWQEDWVEEKRKLELVTLDGYLRVRPELFWRFDLGRRPAGVDVGEQALWPSSPVSNAERTNAGVNMRFRFEPTINISEEVRIRTQIDILDNLVWGMTPDYAFSRNAPSYWNDRHDFSVFSQSQSTPRSGINSLTDSVMVRRVWGEVSTPVGILRFGRMGSHWGLGMLHNDGNGIDSDWGDTVDRISFTAEPIPGYYITPMLDINVLGQTSLRLPEGGQPFNLSNSDDSNSFILALAKRDTESEAKAKLEAGQTVFNVGVHFTYRNQRRESSSLLGPLGSDGRSASTPDFSGILRDANLFIPDVWVKVEQKRFRLEAEVAGILGSARPAFDPSANRIDFWQFGAVLQGEAKLFNGDLEVGGEVGFASGDESPGLGNYPRRRGSGPNGEVRPGDIDGSQFQCSAAVSCTDRVVRNFRFNRDYRNDLILYRELLGGITDSLFIKAKVRYRITQGLYVWASAMYARAIFGESVPGARPGVPGDPNLGIELNGGARYETTDGFFAQVQYGFFAPFSAFQAGGPTASATGITLEPAHAIRGMIGIQF
jgi:uncharacterized protein (TIGR04551 family)